jgi:hypothetical protein
MRAAVVMVVLGLVVAGCSAASTADTAVGCGIVGSADIVGILGSHVDSVAHGSVNGLRSQHHEVTCRNVDANDTGRSVTISAAYHPAPYTLPKKSCSAGWVYAGTPEKYAPACQETLRDKGQSRTQLVVRWQPYLMHVTIARRDRNWGGDPEVALAMSRDLAKRLGVKEAARDG